MPRAGLHSMRARQRKRKRARARAPAGKPTPGRKLLATPCKYQPRKVASATASAPELCCAGQSSKHVRCASREQPALRRSTTQVEMTRRTLDAQSSHASSSSKARRGGLACGACAAADAPPQTARWSAARSAVVPTATGSATLHAAGM